MYTLLCLNLDLFGVFSEMLFEVSFKYPEWAKAWIWNLLDLIMSLRHQPSCLMVKMTHLWNIHQYAGEHDTFIAAHLTNATLKCCWMCEIPLSVLKSHTVSPEFNSWGVFVLLSAAFCYHRRRQSWNTGSGSVWQRRLPWILQQVQNWKWHWMPFLVEKMFLLSSQQAV